MSILSETVKNAGAPFSSANERKAADLQIAGLRKARRVSENTLQKGEQNYLQNYGQGIDAINTAAGTARGDIGYAIDRAKGTLGVGSGLARTSLREAGAAARGEYGRGETTARGDISTGARGAESAITGGTGQAIGALTSGRNLSRTALTGGRDASLGALGTGYAETLAALRGGRTASLGALAGGYGTARGDVTGARDTALSYYDPYAEASTGAAQSYADALGLNGPEGNARATAQFQVGPGYQFELGQGTQAIDRGAASRGELGGGGNSIDVMNYSQGLANKEYGDWLARLFGQQQFGAGIAGSQAGITTGAGTELSGLATGYGRDVAGVETGYGQNVGQAATTYGQNVADVQTGYGRDVSGLETGYGRDVGQLYDSEGRAIADIRTGEGTQLAGITMDASGNIANSYTNEGAGLANIDFTAGQLGAGWDATGGQQLAGIAQTQGQNLLNTYANMGDQSYDFATDLARLKYGTITGVAGANAGFQLSKDQAGANLWNTALGAGQLAATYFGGGTPTQDSTTNPVQPVVKGAA